MARTVLFVAVLTIVSILVTGYCVYCDGHALEIPLVRKIVEPDLFPDDPFVETLDHYPSALWWLVAVLSRLVDLELVLAAGFLLNRLLLLYSGLRLGRALVPEPQYAAWVGAAMLTLAPQALVGSGTTIEVFFEQSGLFMPFFLFALTFLLEHRPIAFALAWGFGFLINPMYGLWAAFIFAGTWLADPDRSSWRALAKAAPLFLFITAPILWQAAVAAAGDPPDHYTWMWINRTVHSIHLFPETWPAELYYKFFGFLALLTVTGWAVRLQAPRLGPVATAWSVLGLLFLALALFSVATEWRRLITLHPARATDPLYLCGTIAVAVAGTCLASRFERRGGLFVFAAILTLTAYLLLPEASPAMLVGMPLAAALLALLFSLFARQSGRQRRIAAALGIAWLVVLIGWVAAADIDRRIEEEGELARALYRRPPSDILRLGEWAREHTDPDAVFFHDPISWDWSHFRYLADRPVYVTWKDASGVLWYPPYAQDWNERFVAFGFNYKMRRQWDPSLPDTEWNLRRTLRSRYRVMRDKNIRTMQKKFRIDYWIAPSRTESAYPVVFEVDAFKVLDVGGR